MSDPTEPVSEAINTSNVVGINEKKRGRPPKEPKPPKESQTEGEESDKPPKLTGGQIETDLVAILERRPITDVTPFPLNQVPMLPLGFQVFRSKRVDDVCLVEVIDNTAYLTTKENVASDLSEFCGQLAGVCLPYNAGLARCERVVKAWSYKRRPLMKIPPPWGFKSDPELCFNRLGYDPVEIDMMDLDDFAPTFAEMSARLKNCEAFWQRVGSIFYNDASRKQAVWVWGPSGGGKSQIAVLLKALMGDAYVGFDNEDFDDAFWKADLIDKRVAYIKEADPQFLHTSVFKSMTGDSGQRMNQKFIRAFEGTINTVTFLASNIAPYVPNDDAIKNRVIPCYMEPVPEERKVSETELAARFMTELPYIAGFCMKTYREHCPHRGAIKFDMAKHLQPAIDNYESEFLDLFDDNFKLNSDEKEILPAKEFKNIVTNAGLTQEEQRRKFKEFLKGRYPEVRETRTRTQRGWSGLSRKY